MFSPMVAIADVIASATLVPVDFISAARIDSSVPSVVTAVSAMPRASAWKSGLRATKSVSELSSIMTARLAWPTTAMRPSAATRPAFLAALARPLVRSQSTAASISPPVSVSAALQSIMPAPVWSRSCFTIPAVMFMSVFLVSAGRTEAQPSVRALAWPTQSSREMRPLKFSASSTLAMSSSEKLAI